MHHLTALSLALPGTPLHGLNEFDPRAPATPPPTRRLRPSLPGIGWPGR